LTGSTLIQLLASNHLHGPGFGLNIQSLRKLQAEPLEYITKSKEMAEETARHHSKKQDNGLEMDEDSHNHALEYTLSFTKTAPKNEFNKRGVYGWSTQATTYIVMQEGRQCKLSRDKEVIIMNQTLHIHQKQLPNNTQKLRPCSEATP